MEEGRISVVITPKPEEREMLADNIRDGWRLHIVIHRTVGEREFGYLLGVLPPDTAVTGEVGRA